MDYDERWRRYRIRLTFEDLTLHQEVIQKVIADAYREWDT
jgi:hypothetical protein